MLAYKTNQTTEELSTQAPHARQIIHKTDRIPTIDSYKVLGSREWDGRAIISSSQATGHSDSNVC